MARKMMTVLALVALFSTAACNNTMGPVADPTDGGWVNNPGDPKPPTDADISKVIIAPDPGEGGGSGSRDLSLGNGHLGSRNRAPIHGDFGGEQGGGGEYGNGNSLDPAQPRRGIETGRPDQP